MSMLMIAAAVAVLAAGEPGPAPPAPPTEARAETGVLAYPASFFAEASPSTAYDMVIRVPGFSFDKGTVVRGLAGSGGNVLIDGEPAVAKNDALDEILKRIPASAVAHVDLIRGGAPGIDMQGRTVMANVVRKSAAGFRGATTLGAYFLYDGRTLTSARTEGQWRWAGGRAAEASFVLGFGPDDQLGDGRRIRYAPNGGILILSDVDADGKGLRIWNTGAFETPLAGGKLRLNAAYMLNPYSAEITDRLRFPGGREYQYDTQDRLQAEVGGRYTRALTPRVALEAVAFQQWNNNDTKSRFEGANLVRKFEGDRKTTESVGRAHLRFSQSATLAWEVGGEGAYNKLDNTTTLFQNGVKVRLPAASVLVTEKRGEVFATATWRPTVQLSVEAGLRQEGSTITSEGDVILEKSLSFTKPRMAVTWSASPTTQLRFRFEREVGQLNFDDFVAPSSVANTGTVIAGNPDLSPQQAWVTEAAVEQRFWKSGAAVLTLRHYALTDVIDRAPIFGAGGSVADAPGNIGEGTKDELQASLSVPLERFGVPAAQLKAQAVWRRSEVTDPLTLKPREISGLRHVEWDLHFSQDLPRLKSNWGIDVNKGGSNANDAYGWRDRAYRLSEVETRKLDTYVTLFGEYKPRPDLSLRVELMNLTERSAQRTREVYAG
ncbi:TonB-dependent siderophore receptor, partial [Phenylobacterium sp.]|uniref:TonB-dependent receptor plug domain-containing protein n=1 Tax=Phenylobacterium sp. TaxID=1871053 RepID=UPI00271D4F1F